MNSNTKKIIIRYSLAVISLFVIAFGLAGVTAINNPYLGPFSAELLTINVSNLTKIPLSIAIITYNCLYFIPIIIIMIKYKKFSLKIFWGIVPILLLSYPLEFFLIHFFNRLSYDSFLIDLIIYLTGFLLSSFGFAVFQAANVFNFPGNEFCEFASEQTHKSFRYYRILCDFLAAVAAFSVMAYNHFHIPNNTKYCGVGTFVLLVTAGYVIQFFLYNLKKIPYIKSFRQ